MFRAATGTGRRQKVSADTFGDLLGSQGFNFAPKQDAGPKTINEMKKADMAKEMDPDKLKVSIWRGEGRGRCGMSSLGSPGCLLSDLCQLT